MISHGLFSRLLFALLLIALDAGLAYQARATTPDAPLVAAASDLQFALPRIVAAFAAETGLSVRVSYGSSGNFARQIRQGAPFEMYLSADERYVLDLARDGFTRDRGALYALGRIVIMAPSGSPLEVDEQLDGLAAGLAADRITHFAIANPDHAPYGQRAREALQHRRLWSAIHSRLVLGENVSQAAQFALSGNTQGGIIAYSLALAPALAQRGQYALIPRDWHQPLRQRMVLLPNAGGVAERFYTFLRTPAARALFRQNGFDLPGGTE